MVTLWLTIYYHKQCEIHTDLREPFWNPFRKVVGGLVTPSCQTLATPWSVACQPPLSNSILQARILEWVAEEKGKFQIIKRKLHVNSLKLCTIFSSICKRLCILLRREGPQILLDSTRSYKPKQFSEHHS